MTARAVCATYSSMLIFRDYHAISDTLKGCVLAIGNFDGVHLGHRAVLDKALAIAKEQHLPCVVMTFHPHPKYFFSPENKPLALEPFHIKCRRLQGISVDGVIALPFDAKLAAMSASQFIADILCDALQVKHVVVGEDFRFGHKRQGDVDFLRNAANDRIFGFGFDAMPPVIASGQPISSSRIRTCLSGGNIKEAARLLGRPAQIYGRVQHGDKRGRAIGVPTANLRIQHLHQPRYGVYAVAYALTDGADCVDYPPEWKDAVANFGIRPTFNGDTPLLEVHALQESGDFYGKFMRVRLIDFIRDEVAFENAEALKTQIQTDIAQARNIFQQYHEQAS